MPESSRRKPHGQFAEIAVADRRLLADIDVPLGVVRGVALLARCAGLLGHIAEEIRDPIAMDMYLDIDRHTDYQPPQ